MIKNKIVFLLFMAFISLLLLSCDSDIILVLDEYNSPYSVTAIPGDSSLSLYFLSGITASDFAGFNFYVNTSGGEFTLYEDAILNDDGGVPTVETNSHVRQFFTYDIPGTYVNGTKYYVSVTAYGTNDLATDGRIETPISSIAEVIPRPEGTLSGITTGIGIASSSVTDGGSSLSFNLTDSTVTPGGSFRIQDFGYQTDFNSIVIVTNNNYSSDFDTIATRSCTFPCAPIT